MTKRNWILGGIGAVLAAGLLVAAPALASGSGLGMMGGRMHGMMQGFSGDMQAMHQQMQGMMDQMPSMHERMTDEMAAVLGLTGEQVRQEMEAGKSLEELAAAQGRDVEQVKAAMREAKAAVLDELVAAGTLTREQADQMLNMMAEMRGSCHGGKSGGMMGGMMSGARGAGSSR